MRASPRWAWGGVLGLAVAAAGCQQGDEAAPPADAPPPVLAGPNPLDDSELPPLPVVLPPRVAGNPAEISAPPPLDLTVSFENATTTTAPPGTNPPPDRTPAGKPAAPFRQAVEQLWPAVRLTTPEGDLAPIRLTLTTDLGPVELALFPEHAPSHVRNLLALAHLGYYDGLTFERVLRADVPVEGGEKQHVEVVTFGCPVSAADRSRGHLGYFLRREESRLDHREGTVGFVRGGDDDSACCRLYICTAASPALNEKFTAVGVVTKGLDTVKAIAARPVKPTRPGNEAEPVAPVKIQSLRAR